MLNVLRASSGSVQEVRSVAGPGSYTTGGNSVRTNVPSVEEAMVEVDNTDYMASVQSEDGNHIVVKMVNVSDGAEVTGGTDLSDDEITYAAYNI